MLRSRAPTAFASASAQAAPKKTSLYSRIMGRREPAEASATAATGGLLATNDSSPLDSLTDLMHYLSRALRADPSGMLHDQLVGLWSRAANAWTKADEDALPWHFDSLSSTVGELLRRPIQLELHLEELSVALAVGKTLELWYELVRRQTQELHAKRLKEGLEEVPALGQRRPDKKTSAAPRPEKHAGTPAAAAPSRAFDVLPLEEMLRSIDEEELRGAQSIQTMRSTLDAASARVALHLRGGEGGRAVIVVDGVDMVGPLPTLFSGGGASKRSFPARPSPKALPYHLRILPQPIPAEPNGSGEPAGSSMAHAPGEAPVDLASLLVEDYGGWGEGEGRAPSSSRGEGRGRGEVAMVVDEEKEEEEQIEILDGKVCEALLFDCEVEGSRAARAEASLLLEAPALTRTRTRTRTCTRIHTRT